MDLVWFGVWWLEVHSTSGTDLCIGSYRYVPNVSDARTGRLDVGLQTALRLIPWRPQLSQTESWSLEGT